MVSIRKVTKDNFHETAKLEVHPHQKHLSQKTGIPLSKQVLKKRIIRL